MKEKWVRFLKAVKEKAENGRRLYSGCFSKILHTFRDSVNVFTDWYESESEDVQQMTSLLTALLIVIILKALLSN